VRVAVIGQGSIGRRHAAIALELGHEVAVYDPSPVCQPPPGVLVAPGARECLKAADAAIVASPSNEHVADVRTAIELGVPVLAEKPLALDAAHAAELDYLAQERGVMLSVAMSMREHAGVQALAKLLAEEAVGDILRASAWCGSWLPGWRPLSDYRSAYSARADLGGGVLLDVAVHELDYLLWLVGPARSVSALVRQVSDLETDVEDVALIVIELASGGVAEVAVDYFDRSYTRGCRIVGSDGTLHWSWEEARLTRRDASGGSSRRAVPSDVAPAYRRQLERFLDAVEERSPPPVPAGQARQVLAVLDAARASSRDGRRVTLAPAVTLRAVRLQDADRLLAWRNDPETRRWSRSSHEITPEEHADWLGRALTDPLTRLWIAESDRRPIAHVRVGPEAHGIAEVHVALAPEARGRGLGAAVLTEAAARTLAEPGISRLYADVKPGHEASLRAFARAAFVPAEAVNDGLVRLERRVRACRGEERLPLP
jgi:predicted dehydrogenase/RimJ/RimL family protein N-acetyltransferase